MATSGSNLAKAMARESGQGMLQVRLDETDKQISQFVTRECARYGTVVSVNIHRSPTAFALVEMANHGEALELSSQLGGSMFGTSVLIHLVQESAEKPSTAVN
jgi:hypothetical protein